MSQFVYGVLTAGYLVAAAFFLKFWSKTREPLLMIFACAFALLAAGQALLGLTDLPREEQTQIYLLRLIAFVLIIAGIVWTNLRRGQK
jgi:hypothetical protein